MDQQQPGITIVPQKPQQEAPVVPTNTQPTPQQPSAPTAPPESQWQFNADASSMSPNTESREQTSSGPTASQSVSWTSSEFIAHEKAPSWYAFLGLGAVVLTALVFFITRDKISASVVIIAALVFAVSASRKPRTLEYKIDEHGATIGPKYYEYSLFKSFAVVDEGAFSGIVLMPLKRFMPQLTIYFEPKDEDKIVDILADRLPMEKHQPDVVDSLMRRIRF